MTKKKTVSVLVMATIMFITLVALGLWQWQRMGWKENILAQIERNRQAEPISMGSVRQKALKNLGGLNAAEYSKVQLSGHYLHQQKLYFFMAKDGQVGWNIYTPLEYKKNHFVFINRGFVPDKIKKKQAAKISHPDQDVKLVGLFRMGLAQKISRFSAENNIVKKQYFWRSVRDMAFGAFGSRTQLIVLGEKREGDGSDNKVPFILPFTLDLVQNDHRQKWPQAGTTILKPANSHFMYMLTWFSFAITLLVITGIFLAGQRRRA